MKSGKIFALVALMAAIAASCAPKAVQTPVVTQPQAAPDTSGQPVPVATSRGDQLEATDPATVSLASGGLQLVEFFRFT